MAITNKAKAIQAAKAAAKLTNGAGSFGKTTVAQPTNAYRTPITNVGIVQDASGSMGYLHDKAVKALNTQVEAIYDGALASRQETHLTVWPFHDNLQVPLVLDRPLNNLPLPTFSPNNYRSNGSSTALIDSTLEAIRRLEAQASLRDSWADNVFLLVVITDGQENAATHRASQLQEALRERVATDKWTLVILCPPGNKQQCIRYGFPAGNVQEWEVSERGLQNVEVQTQAAYSGYFTSRSQGVRSTNAFFQTDLSKVGAKDVKKLTVIPSTDYRLLSVAKESPVREFVESATREPYKLGSAYYLLTKREEVQDHKDLLIQDRTTKKVYGDGTKIRQLLGFPTNAGKVKVDPGNHANWNLFVQSTSTNRKLVRGTTVLVAK